MTLVYRRHVDVLDVDADRHQLTARVFAYDVPSKVVDPPAHSDTGGWDEYIEELAPLSVTGQLANRGSWPRIQLLERHGGPGVGYAIDFADSPTELVGTFRVLPRAWADVEQMVDDGVSGVSGEFLTLATRPGTRGGHVVKRRTRVHLEAVALEPVPAHPDSKILALRAGAPTISTPRRDELAAFLHNRETS